jgi:DnaJ-class molecular chaperone
MAKYLVVKETTETRFCTVCSGTGSYSSTFQGVKTKRVCTQCSGSGKVKIKHRTEVTLEEAIKNIQND